MDESELLLRTLPVDVTAVFKTRGLAELVFRSTLLESTEATCGLECCRATPVCSRTSRTLVVGLVAEKVAEFP